MKNEIWVVTYHFNRGHVIVEEYLTAKDAREAIDIIVFRNKDCINFSCYLKQTKS